MKKRELIALAAQVSGLKHELDDAGCVLVPHPISGTSIWDPYEDGDDALWLAGRLSMEVIAGVSVQVLCMSGDMELSIHVPIKGADMLASTREAIVRAAACVASLLDKDKEDETYYLLKSQANAAHLKKSIEQARAGEAKSRELLDETSEFNAAQYVEAMKLLDDIVADLELRARSVGDVENGVAVLHISRGLLVRYHCLKEGRNGL